MPCGPDLLDNWYPQNLATDGWYGDLGPSVSDLELEYFLNEYTSEAFPTLDSSRFDDYARRLLALEERQSLSAEASKPTPAAVEPEVQAIASSAPASTTSHDAQQPAPIPTEPILVSEDEDSSQGDGAIDVQGLSADAGEAPSKILWVEGAVPDLTSDIEENDVRVASLHVKANEGSRCSKYVFVSIRGGWQEYTDMPLYSLERRRLISASSAVRLEVRVKSRLVEAALTAIQAHRDKASAMSKKQIAATNGLAEPVYAQLPLNDGGMSLTTVLPGTLPSLVHYCKAKCAVCFNPLKGLLKPEHQRQDGSDDELEGRRGGEDSHSRDEAAAADEPGGDGLLSSQLLQENGEVICKRQRHKRSAEIAQQQESGRATKRSRRSRKPGIYESSSEQMVGIACYKIHDKCWDMSSGDALQQSLDSTVSAGLVRLGELCGYTATDMLTCDLCGRSGGAIFGFTLHDSIHVDPVSGGAWMGHWPCVLFLAHSGMLCPATPPRTHCESPCAGRDRCDLSTSHPLELVFRDRLDSYTCSLCGEQSGITVNCCDPTCAVVAHHLCAMLAGWGIHSVQGTRSLLFHCAYHTLAS